MDQTDIDPAGMVLTDSDLAGIDLIMHTIGIDLIMHNDYDGSRSCSRHNSLGLPFAGIMGKIFAGSPQKQIQACVSWSD
jgi:alanine-alpha-ketoisovalerate/valine-pyruvate aminotransferase